MHNHVSALARSFTRALRAAAAFGVVPAFLLLGAGAAQAAQPGRSVQAEPNAMTFGLLGPVGLAAVVLGVLGMAAGVARQRRRARAAEPAGAEMAAMAEAVLAEEPARRTPA